MNEIDKIITTIRTCYRAENIDPANLSEEIAQATLTVVMAGTLNHKSTRPEDTVVLLRALACLVGESSLDMALVQIAQMAGLARVNNGGVTYGCLSAEGPEGDKNLPMTVLVTCNRKNMPHDQIAEFLLRQSEGVKTERFDA